MVTPSEWHVKILKRRKSRHQYFFILPSFFNFNNFNNLFRIFQTFYWKNNWKSQFFCMKPGKLRNWHKTLSQSNFDDVVKNNDVNNFLMSELTTKVRVRKCNPCKIGLNKNTYSICFIDFVGICRKLWNVHEIFKTTIFKTSLGSYFSCFCLGM